MTKKIIANTNEWTVDLLKTYDEVIGNIAHNTYRLDTFPNQIEIISAEHMMDAYASSGMPITYHHWTYGKRFIHYEKNYRRGHMGLAYEIVINSDPCISYLMEENTLTMQALVIAHACYGHNSFFKNNYLFKEWTSPDAIVDYLVFAKKYIAQCEERYGLAAVEDILDACHALMNQGVDKYHHPGKLSIAEEESRQKSREAYLQSQVNDLWRTIPYTKENTIATQELRFPQDPQENILYFLEKNAPLLESWQREIIRIVRKMAQYFYPQRQTKVMNEGWASFWHYTLVNTLYERGYVTDAFMLEFLKHHTDVIAQPGYDSPFFSQINPYTLGFYMFSDIKRICQQPTKEDKRWFPDIAGSPWLETLDYAMQNFRDESFISQFLSPKVIRDLKLFALHDDQAEAQMKVSAIHDDDGYRYIRERLAFHYNLANNDPDIEVWNVNVRGDRKLTLRYYPVDSRPLGSSSEEVLKHVRYLWGFDVCLETANDGKPAALETEQGTCE